MPSLDRTPSLDRRPSEQEAHLDRRPPGQEILSGQETVPLWTGDPLNRRPIWTGGPLGRRSFLDRRLSLDWRPSGHEAPLHRRPPGQKVFSGREPLSDNSILWLNKFNVLPRSTVLPSLSPPVKFCTCMTSSPNRRPSLETGGPPEWRFSFDRRHLVKQRSSQLRRLTRHEASPEQTSRKK